MPRLARTNELDRTHRQPCTIVVNRCKRFSQKTALMSFHGEVTKGMKPATLRITLVYDNSVHTSGLAGNGGFSCLVEKTGAPPVLFDTGTNGTLLMGNMGKLKISAVEIQDVFISHDHHDHVGGLPEFLIVQQEARVYVPASCVHTCHLAREVIQIQGPQQLAEGIWSTGQIAGIEQSMVLDTGDGLVVLVGCAHSGVGNILEAASRYGRPKALIGGLHAFCEWEVITDLDLVCGCHCTQFGKEIERLFPDKWMPGGCGRVFEF